MLKLLCSFRALGVEFVGRRERMSIIPVLVDKLDIFIRHVVIFVVEDVANKIKILCVVLLGDITELLVVVKLSGFPHSSTWQNIPSTPYWQWAWEHGLLSILRVLTRMCKHM